MACQKPRPGKTKNNGHTNKPYDPLLHGEDSWLARCSTSDPSTSEVRDGNGKSRRRKDQRRNKENGPNSTTVNAGFRNSRQNNKTLSLKDNSDELSNLNKILDRLCQIHGTSGKPANHTHRDCWVFKQSGRLAEHKGLDTPSESDETQKQHSGKQKTFPLEVKIVNSLHVITQKHSAAPAIPGHSPQNGDRPYRNSP